MCRIMSHLIYIKMSLLYIERFIRYSRFVADESRDFANIIFFKKSLKFTDFFVFKLKSKTKTPMCRGE